MSEKYKTVEEWLYFLSFSVVGWIDVFIRRIYQEILVDSITYCQKNKNLQLHCYCIMPSHVHLICYSKEGLISNVLRDLKSYTANSIIESIKNNLQESETEDILTELEKLFIKNLIPIRPNSNFRRDTLKYRKRIKPRITKNFKQAF